MPKQGTPPSMEALAQLARELNEASDELTAFLKRREDELNELKLGIEAEGTIAVDGEDETEVVGSHVDESTGEVVADLVAQTVLAYGRHGDRWRIIARTYDLPPGIDFLNAKRNEFSHLRQEFPLLSTSRDLRIVAVESGALEELLEKIATEARRRLSALRSMTKQKS